MLGKIVDTFLMIAFFAILIYAMIENLSFMHQIINFIFK